LRPAGASATIAARSTLEGAITPPVPSDAFDPARKPERFAGISVRRVVAFALDAMIVAVITAVLAGPFWFLGVISLGLFHPLFAAILVAIPYAYQTLFIAGRRAATPGMAILDLEVRRLDGGRPDLLLAALFVALFYASVAFTGWFIVLIGLFNARGRLLHDTLTGLVVVRREAPQSRSRRA